MLTGPSATRPHPAGDLVDRLSGRLQTKHIAHLLGSAPRGGYVRPMCGRVRLSSDVSEIKLVFSIPPHRPTPNIAPSWNVAPTDPVPIIRFDAKAGERSLDIMRWGLVPFWAKDIKVGFSNINAKAEGIEGSRHSARHSSGGAVSCRSITSTNGRRSRPGSSPTQLRSPTGG
jgi:SOS response associated peptidase (SRAP)